MLLLYSFAVRWALVRISATICRAFETLFLMLDDTLLSLLFRLTAGNYKRFDRCEPFVRPRKQSSATRFVCLSARVSFLFATSCIATDNTGQTLVQKQSSRSNEQLVKMAKSLPASVQASTHTVTKTHCNFVEVYQAQPVILTAVVVDYLMLGILSVFFKYHSRRAFFYHAIL